MSEQTAIVTTPQRSFYLAPVADIAEAVSRYDAVKKFVKEILVEGTDYGKIPGADKPSLLKPGAEKMTSFFGLSPRFVLEEKTEDWTGEEHGGEPFFYYRYKCQLYKGDYIVAEGEGSCNSWEKKYRYRQGVKLCPECGQPTIFKSKNKPEFYCWAKKGGCGATFKLNDKRITEQESGQVKNPDPAEQVNTIQKMAQKRSLVAPVLLATNTSEMFTQDVEDFQTSEPTGEYYDAEFEEVKPQNKPVAQPKPAQPAQPKPSAERPYDPETLKTGIAQRITKKGNITASESQSKLLLYALNSCFAGDEDPDKLRHTVTKFLTGKDSTKDLTGAETVVLLDWLHPEKDSGGDYQNNANSVKEAYSIVHQTLIDAGQMTLLEPQEA